MVRLTFKYLVEPELHAELVDVLEADVCQPGGVSPEVGEVQLKVYVLVVAGAEDDVTDLLGHGPAAGGEGSKVGIEQSAEHQGSEGSS